MLKIKLDKKGSGFGKKPTTVLNDVLDIDRHSYEKMCCKCTKTSD